MENLEQNLERRINRLLVNAMVIINGDLQSDNILQRSFNEQGIRNNPMDEKFKESLEQTDITESDSKKDISCAICLEKFKEGEKVIKLPC